MTRHGQEVLEVFVTEMADLLHQGLLDRHHREQLLQDEKECTLKTVTGIITLIICISVISVISSISKISVIICFKCNNMYNYVIRDVFYD
jgi:hypothetical protein